MALLPTRFLSPAVLLFFSAAVVADDFRYLPDKAHVVLSNDMNAMLKSNTFQELKKSGPIAIQVFEEGLANNMGIASADVLRLTLATTYLDNRRPEQVAIVTTSKPVRAAAIRARKKGFVWQVDIRYEPFPVGALTIYEQSFRLQFLPKDKPGPVERGESFCVVEKNVVIYGRLAVLKKILERKQAPELSENMEAVLKETSFKSTIAFAADVQGMPASAKKDLADSLTFMPTPEIFVGRLQSLSLIANEAAEFKAEATLVCKETDEVKKSIDLSLARLKTKLDDAALPAESKQRLKDIRKAIDALKFSVRGEKITASVALAPVVAVKVVEMLIPK